MNSELLQQLRDIQAAPAPPFWPPAPGWWLVTALILLISIYLFKKGMRFFRSRQRRAVILGQLDLLQQRYEAGQDTRAFAAGIAILLRRTALSRFPRTDVAGLTGLDWLQFLDSTSGHQQFSLGVGKVLADGPYQPHANYDVSDLHRLARAWLQRNL